MKKNIGAALALYPSPVIVVCAMVDGKPTWTLVAHAGTVAHSHLMVSLAKADLMGTTSGNKEDKSTAFAYTMGDAGAPLIDEAKVSIECEVDGNYELEKFDNFLCKVLSVYAEETVLNEKGNIDYHVFKPVLFEFPTYEYFVTGDKVGDCAKMNR
ncbi:MULTISPECIES: flavin reductase family protein [Atopobiaceae]|uniref:Flavin reductase like domain-containing protein n=1 Tax=Parafannyhessea umbonata TaxID=604330 RepID=A0A1H6JP21_9ACTN|nr:MULTISPECIES: flavin reductase [Atopobiaceae]SEH63852.1 Flavin reductase like domain-containing protein [Parafannyhessea umbonata]SJZ83360.1 Flavin reductase like domain-containing protein [Olsenella sp. KH1P3]